MDAILNELKSAHNKLQMLVVQNEKKQVELSKHIEVEKSKLNKLNALESELEVKKSKYARYDSLEAMKDSLDKDKASIKVSREIFAKDVAMLADDRKKLEAEKLEVSSLKALFLKKNANCDAYKASLDEEKKSLKESILNEIKKGLK